MTAKARNEGDQCRKSTSCAENSLILKRTRAKRPKLKPEKQAEPVLQSHPVGFESRRRADSLAVPKTFKRSKSLPPFLPDDHFESCTLSLIALLRSAFVSENREAYLFFSSKDAKFLTKLL